MGRGLSQYLALLDRIIVPTRKSGGLSWISKTPSALPPGVVMAAVPRRWAKALLEHGGAAHAGIRKKGGDKYAGSAHFAARDAPDRGARKQTVSTIWIRLATRVGASLGEPAARFAVAKIARDGLSESNDQQSHKAVSEKRVRKVLIRKMRLACSPLPSINTPRQMRAGRSKRPRSQTFLPPTFFEKLREKC
jgi:hypothetical protein